MAASAADGEPAAAGDGAEEEDAVAGELGGLTA
jgi:hypothetical protein